MIKLTFSKQNSLVSLKKVNQFESFIYNFLILGKNKLRSGITSAQMPAMQGEAEQFF